MRMCQHFSALAVVARLISWLGHITCQQIQGLRRRKASHKQSVCGRSGLLPSLIGVCHVAIQFPLYEYAKAKLAERSGCSPDELPAGQLVTPCTEVMLGRVS